MRDAGQVAGRDAIVGLEVPTAPQMGSEGRGLTGLTNARAEAIGELDVALLAGEVEE